MCALFRSRKRDVAGAAATPLFLGDLDGELGTVRLGEPRLLLEASRHAAVAGLAGVAVLVKHEQLRRQRLAAVVALAFFGIDPDPERLGHGSLPRLVPGGFVISAGGGMPALRTYSCPGQARALARSQSRDPAQNFAKRQF